MSRRHPPGAGTTAEARIAEVHSTDVARARALLKDAIAMAREQWLPGNAIADALVQELIDLGSRGAPPTRISAYLRGVAHLLDDAMDAPRTN